MKRLAIALLSFLAAALLAAPAQAFCVVNKTPMTLVAKLQSASPLGDFRKTVDPGKKICCDWFSRRCNPSGSRDALVPLVIESPQKRATDLLPGIAMHYEPIQTYDRHGNPDPEGQYDRNGVYGAPGHPARRGAPVIPNNRLVTTVPDTSESDKAHYCARGRSRHVLAGADGTVTVTVHARSPGGLSCESRDRFLRPIAPPSQATQFGVPLLDVPSRARPSGGLRFGN